MRVLEAAAICLAKSAYNTTSMIDVEAEASLSKSLLHDYFDNKKNLFYAVFNWSQRRFMEATLAPMTPGHSACEQITCVADAAVASLIQRVSLYPVSLEVWAAASRAGIHQCFIGEVQQIYQDYRQQFAGHICEAQAACEIKGNADDERSVIVLTRAADGPVFNVRLPQVLTPAKRSKPSSKDL